MAGSFHSTASAVASRFSGIVAASMVAATYAVAPMPAAAVDNLPAQCAKAGNELAQLRCGTRHYRERRLDAEAQRADAKARSADAKARGAAADARGAAADARSAAADARGAAADKKIAGSQNTKECMDGVTRDIQEASKAGPLKPDQVKAFENRISGCERS